MNGKHNSVLIQYILFVIQIAGNFFFVLYLGGFGLCAGANEIDYLRVTPKCARQIQQLCEVFCQSRGCYSGKQTSMTSQGLHPFWCLIRLHVLDEVYIFAHDVSRTFEQSIPPTLWCHKGPFLWLLHSTVVVPCWIVPPGTNELNLECKTNVSPALTCWVGVDCIQRGLLLEGWLSLIVPYCAILTVLFETVLQIAHLEHTNLKLRLNIITVWALIFSLFINHFQCFVCVNK